MLVLIGATPEGKKELIGFQVGARESAQNWRELLVEVKRRGLKIAPEIAVGQRLEGVGVTPTIEVPFDPPAAGVRGVWVERNKSLGSRFELSGPDVA
jgi:putative transposase